MTKRPRRTSLSSSAKGASSEVAWQRHLRGACRCPQRPMRVVDEAIVQEHAVAYRDEDARAKRHCDVFVRLVDAGMGEQRTQKDEFTNFLGRR